MMANFKKLITAGLLLSLSCALSEAAPPAPHCAQDLFCLFNHEAAAKDLPGIRKYSEDLIGLIVQGPAGNQSVHQLEGPLANRLASAEQAARAGDGKLVSEKAVVKAFNDLMQQIGAPPSMKATESNLHGFREHAAAIKAFPVLLSADRHGTNCNPGEAVFLVSLLLSDHGVLMDGNLDAAVAMVQSEGQVRQAQSSVAGGVTAFGSNGDSLLSWYSSHHNRNASKALFDHMTAVLGF